MKKLVVSVLLLYPMFSSAATLQFNATGNNFKFSNYGITPNSTGSRNVGQFGSFSIAGSGGGTFSATYLGQESGYANNYFQKLELGTQTMGESTLGSTLSSSITGPGLIDFGFFSTNKLGTFGEFDNGDAAKPTLGFVVLKQFVKSPTQTSVASAGYDNTTTFGSFDYLIGFNDNAKVDADYDDYVIGIKFTPTAVPLPAALPLMASAIGLFGFGANRRRV